MNSRTTSSSLMAYHSGQFKPLDDVSIPLNDAGFVYGATATDQCRTYHQRPFRITDHLARFRQSCQLCKIPEPLSDKELAGIVETLLTENNAAISSTQEWTIILLATPGNIPHFLGLPGGLDQDKPHLIIYLYPLPFHRFRNYFQSGAEIRIAKNTSHLPDNIIPRPAKHRSRLFWWLAEQEVRQHHPHAQALLHDEDGCITETSSANLLLVRNNTVMSPSLSRILPGVSLRVVKELCHKASIPFDYADLHPNDLTQADEAFLSSTPYGIAPIGNLNGKHLPINGHIFQKLLAAWNDLVGLDIREQFLLASPS